MSFAGLLSPAYGFGYLGHRLVGEVAQQHLCEDAQTALKELNDPYSFVTAGSWADKVRYRPEWRHTRTWHYININGDTFDSETGRKASGDVLWAIEHYGERLRDKEVSDDERREAMLFYVHFVADLHQPLHSGYSSDLGGNKVKVSVGGRKTNLHSVWDTGLLQYNGLDENGDPAPEEPIQDYIQRLLALSAGNTDVWQDSTPQDWLLESMALRPDVYAFDETGAIVLGDQYLSESKEIIDVRLAQAGVRLAGELNAIWCPAPVSAN